ncbi:hypothetical protein PLICBS_004203 [Purpureocillium lilacinum]|uniref:uncharacterized protein n=1 Tax=Purpureocillium lilacinum TaxID=33203 RepID=UPI00208B02E9|nr:hypothetical protein PLICBS_004203 [Purpureocillium lilacinum]
MSAPYWGQLPEPQVVKDRRRMSAGLDSNEDSSRRAPNRASVQTSYTDALTESTFSPHSPTTSSLAGAGLAPRPPSYQRQNRVSRPTDHHDTSRPAVASGLSTPPAAPDAPRGPPVSYRQPYANGGLPYTYPTAVASAAPHDSEAPLAAPLRDEDMEPEAYYTTRHDAHFDGSSQLPVRDVAARRDADVAAQPRRASAAGSSAERRRKLAIDRSPLQRLELTLDSMTKEEKRARVQAAEQRARQRAAAKAAAEMPVAREAQPEEQYRTDRHLQQAPHMVPAPVSMPAPVSVAQPMPHEPARREVSARHEPPSHSHPQEDHYDYRLAPWQAPQQSPRQQRQQPRQASRHEAVPPQLPPPRQEPVPSQLPPPTADSGVPKRNLSFRERTAQNDGNLVGGETQPVPSGGGFALTRSGSNKLRKEPPPEARYRQMGAERSVSMRQNPTGPPRPERIVPLEARNKELPPPPPEARGALSHDNERYPAFVESEPMHSIQRRATEPSQRHREPQAAPVTSHQHDVKLPAETQPDQTAVIRHQPPQEADSEASHPQSHVMPAMSREDLRPGDGLYKAPEWLDEWKKGTTGTLSGVLLDVSREQPSGADPNKAWWETGRAGGNSNATRRKAEAFDGEYDDTTGPTRFKPQLYLKCGPLLRYCGIRRERIPTRSGGFSEREIWRGSIMIVTRDSESSYEIAPMLRLFVQNVGLLPRPPHQVNGDLPPEYVDPIAGHPKLGRRGETLYVRPVEHLEEARDLSRDETDNGLFEKTKSPPDVLPDDGSTDLPGSFARRRKAVGVDGEKLQKYKDVRGFRLHAERGHTFWRFNIEVELQAKQQRIAYRINRGPCMGFWVPARGEAMNIMFYSCNGFSLSAKPDELSGPDPMWRDVLNTHQTQPFHAMIGGGDQLYNDCISDECQLFDEWLDIRNPHHKHNAPFSPEMQDEMEEFYLERYCMWFSQGLFGLANSQIPMVNMYDDHDIFDGYGSYPDRYMNSPVFRGLGAVAFKYYMLFQHQSLMGETENTEPSWILGDQPGPYIGELSRSVYMSMGGKVALLAVDCRTERTEHDVIGDKTWEKIMNRLYAELRRGQVEHLLVLLGVPIAYPRLVWLENILTSRLMHPVKALGRTGVLGKALNNIDGGVEVLDDLNDHWTAKNHKHERSIIIEDLQDLAIDKSMRVTILSGDVHLAAVGQFFSNPKLGLAKHKDPRYMPNIISSAMANAPPSDLMADVLNKRNKVHHFDKQTDENMIPLFQHGVDGKARNNKHLLPHRNWCQIRAWSPGNTPPPTPPLSAYDGSPSPPPSNKGGIFRRLSSRRQPQAVRFDGSRDSVRGPKPPVSGGMGFFRSLSRRNSTDGRRPAKLTRTMSLGRGDGEKRGFFGFGRRGSESRPDDGGINGQWGADSDEDEYYGHPAHPPPAARPSGLRGGGTYDDEYAEGDDSYFTARPLPPRRAVTLGNQPASAGDEEGPVIRPFHRTPTGLSTKQMKKAEQYEVDLEGGLDITLNVEVNPKDPTGITVPYRLLVPRLQYEYDPASDELAASTKRPAQEPRGFKRLFSIRRRKQEKADEIDERPPSEEDEDEDEDDYLRR